jgi:uroporphyrinogen-III decarboxylase
MLVIGLNQAGLTLYDHSPAAWLGNMALANFDVFNFSNKVDMAEIMAKMNQRVARMWNVPALDVGVRGQPIDAIRWARTCLEKGSSGGDLILSFVGGVSPDTLPDNIDALVQVVHDLSGAQ